MIQCSDFIAHGLDRSEQRGRVNATTCPQFSVHVNYHFDSGYTTAFNSRFEEIMSNLTLNTSTPPSLGKLSLHIAPGVLRVLLSVDQRVRGVCMQPLCSLPRARAPTALTSARTGRLAPQTLAPATGERLADLPVMSCGE